MNRGNEDVALVWAAVGTLVLLVVSTMAGAQQPVSHPDLVVAKPVVNMLRHADGTSDVVSQAIYGTAVVLLEKDGAWERVRTADEYTGWVATSEMTPLTAGPYAPDGRVVRVTALSANVYREPDVTRHAPLLQLPWEARVELMSDKTEFAPRWLEVRLVNGQTAWVQRGDVSLEQASVSIADMLEMAHRFLGITYTWGGVSSYGFDCSGFTQMLERQRGIVMPRDADLQAAWSRVVAVERKDLQPGDLLFFGSSPAKITHTGMYLGNGEFIHDTTHDHPGVQISKLDDMPWTKLLVAARRVK